MLLGVSLGMPLVGIPVRGLDQVLKKHKASDRLNPTTESDLQVEPLQPLQNLA